MAKFKKGDVVYHRTESNSMKIYIVDDADYYAELIGVDGTIGFWSIEEIDSNFVKLDELRDSRISEIFDQD